DDRRRERGAGAHAAAAILVVRRDRGAEHALRRPENFYAAAARTVPRGVLFSHAADGHESVDLASEDCRKAIDHLRASASAVDVVAGDDEEKFLAVRVATSVRVDAEDHVVDLLLHRGVWNGCRVGAR